MAASDTEKQFELAVLLRDQGSLAEARNVLERLTVEDGATLAELAVLGDVYWDLGNLSAAIETFRRCTTMAPMNECVSLGLFHTLWQSGQHEQALDEMKRFVQSKDSNEYREILAEINQASSTSLIEN